MTKAVELRPLFQGIFEPSQIGLIELAFGNDFNYWVKYQKRKKD
jgi:hypothetical protein